MVNPAGERSRAVPDVAISAREVGIYGRNSASGLDELPVVGGETRRAPKSSRSARAGITDRCESSQRTAE